MVHLDPGLGEMKTDTYRRGVRSRRRGGKDEGRERKTSGGSRSSKVEVVVVEVGEVIEGIEVVVVAVVVEK